MTEEVINKTQIKNGVISEFVLGITPDTKQLTAWVVVNFGQAKQGFGGLDLAQGNAAVVFIINTLTIVGVNTTAELVGKAVRVEHDKDKIYALGNFMDDGKWYHIDTGMIQEVPPSLLPPPIKADVPKQPDLTVVENDDGKKHYTGNSEAGVVGAEVNS
jgi:hypothetical protein